MSQYFNEEVVHAWVCEYLDLPAETRQTTSPGKELREKILVEVQKVVVGEIWTHHFYVWENVDDLIQIGLEACITALEKFNPDYYSEKTGEIVTCFNFFSLTAKRSMKFNTMHSAPHRCNSELGDDWTITGETYVDKSSEGMKNIIDNLSKVKTKWPEIKQLFGIYLSVGGRYNKREFFRFARCFGWSPNITRKFMKEVWEEKDRFYDSVEENLDKEICRKTSNVDRDW